MGDAAEGEDGDSAAKITKGDPSDETVWKDLHKLLLETQVLEGKLVCGNCGHEYAVREGIANFLLPDHLGMSPFHATAKFARRFSLLFAFCVKVERRA